MEILAKIICCFVPVKRWRKSLRKALFEDRERYERKLVALKKCGPFEVTEIDGVRVAAVSGLKLGHVFDGDGMVIVEEVFGNGEYHFDTGGRSVVIDIGMNIGLASLYFASRDDVECVYGFEPFKPTFDQALFNFRINPDCAEKIHPANYGLGSGEKQLTLDYCATVPGQMSTVKHIDETHPWRKDRTKPVTVQIRDAAAEIGAILKQHPDKKVVVKCDTEGAEKEIFERLDADGLLGAIDVVMLEYHFSYDKPVCEILGRNGYIIFKQKLVLLDTGEFGMIRAVRK
jgi:FkbM family methyltransferase